MFNVIDIEINAFVQHLQQAYHRTYGGSKPDYADIIGWAGSGVSGGEPGALALVAAGDAPAGLAWREATAATDARVAAGLRLLRTARTDANAR